MAPDRARCRLVEVYLVTFGLSGSAALAGDFRELDSYWDRFCHLATFSLERKAAKCGPISTD
jgi:hypothetical protein